MVRREGGDKSWVDGGDGERFAIYQGTDGGE